MDRIGPFPPRENWTQIREEYIPRRTERQGACNIGVCDYSSRSATIALTRDARCAGKNPAASPTHSSNPAAIIIVGGSLGATPNSSEDTQRDTAHAQGNPSTTPNASIRAAS